MDRIHFDAAACDTLEDYTALEYILLGDLRDLLEEPADHFTRSWLVAVLDALLDTLPRRDGVEGIQRLFERSSRRVSKLVSARRGPAE